MSIDKYKSFYKDLFFDFDSPILEEIGARSSKKRINTSRLFSRETRKFNFKIKSYNLTKNSYFNPIKTLSLNFTRSRFFPSIRDLKGQPLFFLSLGLLAKFLLKGKAFTKSKTVYLLLASFLRKVLLFSSFKNMYLFVKKTPLFFKEIMSTINDPVVSIYKNPFSSNVVNEKEIFNNFSFPIILFMNNKAYGYVKVKQKGRLKRKISKRITVLNKVLD